MYAARFYSFIPAGYRGSFYVFSVMNKSLYKSAVGFYIHLDVICRNTRNSAQLLGNVVKTVLSAVETSQVHSKGLFFVSGVSLSMSIGNSCRPWASQCLVLLIGRHGVSACSTLQLSGFVLCSFLIAVSKYLTKTPIGSGWRALFGGDYGTCREWSLA